MPPELAVGILVEGEGIGDSVLVLTEEQEMTEGQLIGGARARE
jgi:hypothetical protein